MRHATCDEQRCSDFAIMIHLHIFFISDAPTKASTVLHGETEHIVTIKPAQRASPRKEELATPEKKASSFIR